MLAAIRCDKGDVDGNLATHLRLLRSAAAAGCDLAVFPEMSLTGSVDPDIREISPGPSCPGDRLSPVRGPL
jgi:predicted amidohydrolase